MPVKVSIITVYYNTPAELLRLSDSIRQWLPEQEIEWIIIDNHSEQDLSAAMQQAKYVRMTENRGFGAGCNAGAKHATAPVLFFINPDCELLEDCASPLMKELQTYNIVGPQVVLTPEIIQLSFGPFLSILSELRQMLLMKMEQTTIVQEWLRSRMKRPFRVDYVSGCALMISTELFQKAGGFDEVFFLYEEDVDLCKRIGGKRVACIPHAKILHARNRSTQKEPSRSSCEYRKSQLYYYRKHQTKFQQALLKLYLKIRFAGDPQMLRLITEVPNG